MAKKYKDGFIEMDLIDLKWQKFKDEYELKKLERKYAPDKVSPQMLNYYKRKLQKVAR